MIDARDSRPAYGRIKRLRRGALMAAGRWTRRAYDVRLVYANGRPAYKEVVFQQPEQARRAARTLQGYGASAHLPELVERRGNVVVVTYVAGRVCTAIDDRLLPELARCFAEFGQRGSRCVAARASGYPRALERELGALRAAGVADRRLYEALCERARRVLPATLRVGYDYTDPIGANLVERADTGAVCAIDIKNLRADTLVGQGLAKAGARWLTRARRPAFFAYLNDRGLGDIERGFAFLRLFEQVRRIGWKTRRDTAFIGRLRGHAKERAKLARLAE